jgi:hypothetical protein
MTTSHSSIDPKTAARAIIISATSSRHPSNTRSRPVAECGKPFLGSLPCQGHGQGSEHEPLGQVEKGLGRSGPDFSIVLSIFSSNHHQSSLVHSTCDRPSHSVALCSLYSVHGIKKVASSFFRRVKRINSSLDGRGSQRSTGEAGSRTEQLKPQTQTITCRSEKPNTKPSPIVKTGSNLQSQGQRDP